MTSKKEGEGLSSPKERYLVVCRQKGVKTTTFWSGATWHRKKADAHVFLEIDKAIKTTRYALRSWLRDNYMVYVIDMDGNVVYSPQLMEQ